MMWAYFFLNRLYGYIALWTYPPGPLKLSILPNTQLEYFQVEYFKKYSTYLMRVECFLKYSSWVFGKILNLIAPGG